MIKIGELALRKKYTVFLKCCCTLKTSLFVIFNATAESVNCSNFLKNLETYFCNVICKKIFVEIIENLPQHLSEKFCTVCSSGTVKTETEKNLFSNFIFDVSLGNERQASSENTVTWEGNQPRSRTVKRSSTDLTELIKKLRSVNWINPINYCVTKRRNA